MVPYFGLCCHVFQFVFFCRLASQYKTTLKSILVHFKTADSQNTTIFLLKSLFARKKSYNYVDELGTYQ